MNINEENPILGQILGIFFPKINKVSTRGLRVYFLKICFFNKYWCIDIWCVHTDPNFYVNGYNNGCSSL